MPQVFIFGVSRGAQEALFQDVPGSTLGTPAYVMDTLGLETSGAKHSPLSSVVWGHQIVENQVSRYYRNQAQNIHHFLNTRINGIRVSEFRINENTIIIPGCIW